MSEVERLRFVRLSGVVGMATRDSVWFEPRGRDALRIPRGCLSMSSDKALAKMRRGEAVTLEIVDSAARRLGWSA